VVESSRFDEVEVGFEVELETEFLFVGDDGAAAPFFALRAAAAAAVAEAPSEPSSSALSESWRLRAGRPAEKAAVVPFAAFGEGAVVVRVERSLLSTPRFIGDSRGLVPPPRVATLMPPLRVERRPAL